MGPDVPTQNQKLADRWPRWGQTSVFSDEEEVAGGGGTEASGKKVVQKVLR